MWIELPAYSVYAYILRPGKHLKHRGIRLVVFTYYERIVDYWDLKENVLLPAAKNIYHDPRWNHKTETVVAVEKHIRGKYRRGFAGHATDEIYYKREPSLKAKILYLPHSNEVKVERADFFAPEFWDMKADYRRERSEVAAPACGA
jgi:hypothetical protein